MRSTQYVTVETLQYCHVPTRSGVLSFVFGTVWTPSQVGPLEINMVDTLDVLEEVLLSTVCRTKWKDEEARTNNTTRRMLLIVGSSIPRSVESVLPACSECVIFYRISGMKLNQASQVRARLIGVSNLNEVYCMN